MILHGIVSLDCLSTLNVPHSAVYTLFGLLVPMRCEREREKREGGRNKREREKREGEGEMGGRGRKGREREKGEGEGERGGRGRKGRERDGGRGGEGEEGGGRGRRKRELLLNLLFKWILLSTENKIIKPYILHKVAG